MPLTAYDPETGRVVLATWPVSSPQCKDPACRSKLHLVRGTEHRVQHFRHSTHCTTAPDQIRERESMSPWHLWWQSQCADPVRIEVTDVNTSGDVRRADVLTPFGWCIEVQHSAIAAKTIRARENHWNGKVLWLVDAASSDRQVDFSIDEHRARLDGVWVHHLSTVIAVDDGEGVWLFPWSVLRFAGEVQSKSSYMRRLSHEQFIDTWINGHAAPFDREPQTKWRKSAEHAKRNAAEREAREQLARQRALRELRQAEVSCEYQGPRANLIHEEPIATPEPVAAPEPLPPTPVQPERAYDVVVDIRDTVTEPPVTRPIIDWRKTDSSRHPVTRLPAHHNRSVACWQCARLVQHGQSRLKCDANWTPTTATDINPDWAACSVWLPHREEH